jgi:hypothetical protein
MEQMAKNDTPTTPPQGAGAEAKDADKTPGQAAQTQNPSEGDAKEAKGQGGDDSAIKQAQFRASLESGDTSNAPRNGKVLRRDQNPGGPRYGDAPSGNTSRMHVVEEDVYEEVWLDGFTTPMYRKVFRKHQLVNEAEYKRVVEGRPHETPDASLMVGGAEGRVGGTTEPAGPAKVAASGQRG